MSRTFAICPAGVRNQGMKNLLNRPMSSSGMPIIAGRAVPRLPLHTVESQIVSIVISPPAIIRR